MSGSTDGFIRLTVGVEDIDDLIEDWSGDLRDKIEADVKSQGDLTC